MYISIIVPVYNRSHIIKDTLDSIMAQTHEGFELIIVDNNSTDDTCKVLNDYFATHTRKDVTVKILSESIPGAPSARNKGLQAATNEWIIFFDSDDIMEPTLLEFYVTEIKASHKKLDMVFAPTDSIDLNGNIRYNKIPTHDNLALQILHATFYTISYMVRKDVAISVGAWDVNLPGWNDWEFGIRLLLKHRKIARISTAPLAHHICHKDSITGLGYADKWNIWETAINKAQSIIESSSIKNKKYYLLLIAYRRLSLAGLCSKEKSPESKSLYHKAMYSIRNYLWLRPIFAFLYRYIGWGGKGGSHIANTWIKLFVRHK